MDELASYYHNGSANFWVDWQHFTGSESPVVVNRNPRLVLAARDIDYRTKAALEFLIDNGLPVHVTPIAIYEGPSGQRFVEIDREEDQNLPGGASQPGESHSGRLWLLDGRRVQLGDLVEAGLLAPGTTIELVRGEHDRITATITGDGHIAFADGSSYGTPSGAGRAVLGFGIDGWVTWRLEDGRTLADVRTQLVTQKSTPVVPTTE